MKKIEINVKPRVFTDAEISEAVNRKGKLHLKIEVLSGLPEGLNDNDPELLTAFEKKFENMLKAYEGRAAGLMGSDKYLADEVEKGLPVPNIESIRIDCIENYLYKISEAEKVYNRNRLSPQERLVLRQFLAYLERKKNEKNDNSPFSVLEWATIFYYADEKKLLEGKTKAARMRYFIEKHKIKTTFGALKKNYSIATNRINTLAKYPIEKLEKIIPFIVEHYPTAERQIKEDKKYLTQELPKY